MIRSFRPLAAGLSLATCVGILAGCAGLPADHGRSEVTALLAERGLATADNAGEPITASAIALAESNRAATPPGPLTLDAAVRLALVGNPGLRARFAELGFAAAEVYDAGRLSNPELGLGYMFVERGDLDDEKSVGLTQNFTELLLLPARRRLADGEFERVQQAVAGAVQHLVADVARAWYQLAGAAEMAAIQQESAAAARLAADLAARYADAGNLERRALAEARAAAATARLEALQGEFSAAEARARLARVLGTAMPAERGPLTAGLPPPDTDPAARAELLHQADSGRLDLAAARRAVAVSADALGVTRQFRYLGSIEAGPRWEWNEDGMRSWGPKLGIELPLFNRGAGKIARAEAELALAEAELAGLELGIVTDIDRSTAAVANARARFEQYRETLLPNRREIVARRQEEVNFMLEGPFVLLDAKQDEYQAAAGLLEATRDYWLARVELARAVGQEPPTSAADAADWMTAAKLTGAMPAPVGAHHHHGEHP